MQSFDIEINGAGYRVIPASGSSNTFNLFNHLTFHVIKKDEQGKWGVVEHRFGTDIIPLKEIGEAIDNHSNQ